MTNKSDNCNDVNCAINRKIMPPDYELDDYWMKEVVLKDSKDEEADFYSAYGYFSSSSLYPLPDYIAKKIASAPPYDWYKHHSSDSVTKKQPYRCNSVKEKKKTTTKQNHIQLRWGRKRKRSFKSVSSSYSSPENEKKNKSQEEKDRSVLSFKLSFKKQKNSHSWSLVDKVTTAVETLSPRIEDKNQQQFDHHLADHSRKSSTHDQIISAADVPSAVTRMPILHVQEELINNLITAKMGGCDHLMLVIQKKLRDSDLKRQQNRFSIPFQQVLNDFINSEEKARLNNEETRKIKVNLLVFNLQQQQQPYLEEDKVHSVNFTKWVKNSIYVLNGSNWPSIVQQHKLEKHMVVQLWAFRLHSQLSFALVKT